MGTRAVPPALSATDTVEADRDAEGTVGHTDDAARSSTGDDLLRFAGTWEGDDLEACLDLVYATRSQARF